MEWTSTNGPVPGDALTCRNLLSYSDGPRGNSTGRLLFYLTPLDATATDVEVSMSGYLLLHISSKRWSTQGSACGVLHKPSLSSHHMHLQERPGATLTVGEVQLAGGCNMVDPEVSVSAHERLRHCKCWGYDSIPYGQLVCLLQLPNKCKVECAQGTPHLCTT